MAKLSTRSRKRSQTLPGGRFPMPDRSHARNALARIGQAKGLSASAKRKVVSRAYRILGKSPSQRRVKISSAGRVTKKK